LNVILLLVSGLTIFIAGLGANFEFDLRRIIALSTLRQLGLTIMTISIGVSSKVFLHLLTHALFKALLFTCAGGVIHSIGDSQDIRFMGGLSIYIPFTSSSLIVSNFAVCGIPFVAGFILGRFSMRYVNMFGFFLLFVSTGLTVCCRLKQASSCNTNTTQTQPHQISNTQRTENKTTDFVIQQHSRKLLMMDILMSETC